MKISTYLTGVIKMLIILFWANLLFLFLFIPRLREVIYTKPTLNLLVWTNTINSSAILEFEKETGIKVNVTYFENNEELFVKLQTSRGTGYDLIMPTDYLVRKLITHNLLKPIDHTKLNFFSRLDRRLLNHYFDPQNKFTIPYYWAIYGLGVNKLFFNKREQVDSWALLFKSSCAMHSVAMINVAREAILMGGLYLFKNIGSYSSEQLNLIKSLLVKQKHCVATYIDADVRSNYMLSSKTVPVAIASSPYIHKIMSEHPGIEFVVPQEGTFRVIDSFALPIGTAKCEEVYRLLNYLYKKEFLEEQFVKEPFFPATQDLAEFMHKYNIPLSVKEVHANTNLPLYFFQDNIISEADINAIWMAVKT